MLGLREVALDGLVAGWEILGGIGVGKPGPGGLVAGFDGGYPGGIYWKSCGGEEVVDKDTNAGEVLGVEGSRGCWISGMD